jgi:fido (protein-threonine AMPylation protein)
MHPLDCPDWEYSNHPQRATIGTRVTAALRGLATGTDTLSVATDTREVHGHVFHELTPVGCAYYAGHYRGEEFRCLRFYPVCVPGDPRVGATPYAVAFRMRQINAQIRAGVTALDANRLLTAKDRLYCIVALASRAFVAFLEIHPYANGNGHAGRFIVWSIMGRYGYWPRRWPVDPRPPDPPYTQLIVQCRNGDPTPLERYLLQAIAST